jgi:hypothetical protein
MADRDIEQTADQAAEPVTVYGTARGTINLFSGPPQDDNEEDQ